MHSVFDQNKIESRIRQMIGNKILKMVGERERAITSMIMLIWDVAKFSVENMNNTYPS